MKFSKIYILWSIIFRAGTTVCFFMFPFFFYFLGQFSTNDHDGNYARKYEKLYAQFYAYFSLFDKILMKYCIVSDIWNTRLQVR